MGYMKRGIPDSFTVLSGPYPPDPLCFKSDRLQILYNSRNTPFQDPGMHLHAQGDEAYLVLQGGLMLIIEEEHVYVGAGEICFVPAGTSHALVQVITLYRGFVIRAPAVEDKISKEFDDHA